jgi:hypothetical protein
MGHNNMEIMLDLETLGTKQDAIILTIGAQVFDPTSTHLWVEGTMLDTISGDRITGYMNARIDVDDQETLGRTCNEDTLKWWASQSPEAQEEAFSEHDRVPLSQALLALSRMVEVCGPKKWVRVWSKGPTFDINILEHAMEQTGVRIPWEFWNVRDARTVYGLCPRLDTKQYGETSHRALDDCRNQIKLLRSAFEILSVTQLR